MVGLVFADALRLSPAQWLALVTSMGILLWRDVSGRVLLCVHALLLAAFWNAAMSIDTRLLFQSSAYLHPFAWPAFLTELAFRDYVKLQPPFYTFWVSRWPSLPLHQTIQAAAAVGGGLLMRELYGEAAKYLLSTPLYLLLSTQPGNDFTLFLGLVVVLQLIRMRRRSAAALLFGLLWLLKPLVIVTLPVLIWHFRGAILLAGGMVAGYLWWSLHYYFGVLQWNFLLQQLLLSKFFAR
jgi:hypothetical protein